MKIQELAIIFVIIILPISLLLSEYTQFQIKTISMQTEYDSKLTVATYDAIKAYQLNSINESYSDLANENIRGLEASVATFRNSIMTAFKLNGYTEDELDNYIPALVYTLYDGFYIYSPYANNNYRDEDGNLLAGQPIKENAEEIYGLKPYIKYSCRYQTSSIDVVITYALDNYVTVQGQIEDKYVNKSGYLIDGIEVLGATVKYNGIEIEAEHLKENVLGKNCSYVKVNGVKYYLIENYNDGETTKDVIAYISNGNLLIDSQKTDNIVAYKSLIENNDSAIQYYKQADEFTEWFKSTELVNLTYGDAKDEVINSDGTTQITNIWSANDTKIFDFNNSTDPLNNIENETSEFNQHRLAIIRHKIETNLAIAVSNYNNYSGAVTLNVFQMPELKEDEWEHITHNICMISFLQGLPIGGKIYNGYSLVTNSESKEVVLEEYIHILGKNVNNNTYSYHKINDNGFKDGSVVVDSGSYSDNYRSAGRLNLDFKRHTLTKENEGTYYYYPLKDYNASYDSVVMQNNVTTYDDIYEYVNNCGNDNLKKAFYIALGRERFSKYNSNNEIKEILPVSSLTRSYDASNLDGNGTTGTATTTLKDLLGNYDATIYNSPTFGNGYIALNEGNSSERQYIDIGPMLNKSKITIDLTFSVSQTGISHHLIGNWQDGGFGMSINAAGKIGFAVYRENGTKYEIVRSNTIVSANTIYNVKGVYDGKNLYIYVNGNIENTIETDGGNIKDPVNNEHTIIGGNPSKTGISSELGKMKFYKAEILTD